VGGAKDKHKYREIYYLLGYFYTGEITFREVAIRQPDLLSIYHFRFEITEANKNATASQS